MSHEIAAMPEPMELEWLVLDGACVAYIYMYIHSPKLIMCARDRLIVTGFQLFLKVIVLYLYWLNLTLLKLLV